MSWLREWIWQLAGIIILSSVCEMIIPGGSMQKYIRLVMGMLLTVSVMRPIVNIPEFSVEEIGKNSMQVNAVKLKEESDKHEFLNVMKLYKEKLCVKLEALLMNSGKVNADVKVEVSEKNDSFGEITRVTVLMRSENGNDKTFEKVRKIIGEEAGIETDRIRVVLLKEKG